SDGRGGKYPGGGSRYPGSLVGRSRAHAGRRLMRAPSARKGAAWTSRNSETLLYRFLGQRETAFDHVPLAMTPDGRRLAKRDGSIKLSTPREAGVDPHRLVGGLVQSWGWSATSHPSQPEDWLQDSRLTALSPEPWVVTEES